MRQAMDDLVRKGLLVRKRGVGTQVVTEPVRRALDLTSLFEDLTSTGRTPATKIISFEHRPVEPQIQDLLQLPPRSSVYHVIRLRSVDGEPLSLMENWINGTVPDITPALLETQGLYGVLHRAGMNLRVASQSIGAATSDTQQAGLLCVAPGSALVTMQRTASDENGRAIETGRHLYRADSYTFDMTLVQRDRPVTPERSRGRRHSQPQATGRFGKDPTMTTESIVDKCHDLNAGDLIAARHMGFLVHRGRVTETVPEHGLFWIMDELTGGRRLLDMAELEIIRATQT